MGQKKKSQEKLENIKLNDNENTSNYNMWEATDAVFIGKFIVLNDYTGVEKGSLKLMTQESTFTSN